MSKQGSEEVKEIAIRPSEEQHERVCDALDIDKDASPVEKGDALLEAFLDLIEEEEV